jgi:hypothetical protein
MLEPAQREPLWRDLIRVLVAGCAAAWVAVVFWWPGVMCRDGPPELSWIITTIHVPLTLALVFGGHLALVSRGPVRAVGFACLLVCVPAAIGILTAALRGQAIWVYCRG